MHTGYRLGGHCLVGNRRPTVARPFCVPRCPGASRRAWLLRLVRFLPLRQRRGSNCPGSSMVRRASLQAPLPVLSGSAPAPTVPGSGHPSRRGSGDRGQKDAARPPVTTGLAVTVSTYFSGPSQRGKIMPQSRVEQKLVVCAIMPPRARSPWCRRGMTWQTQDRPTGASDWRTSAWLSGAIDP